jgi:hypothetical protein
MTPNFPKQLALPPLQLNQPALTDYGIISSLTVIHLSIPGAQAVCWPCLIELRVIIRCAPPHQCPMNSAHESACNIDMQESPPVGSAHFSQRCPREASIIA